MNSSFVRAAVYARVSTDKSDQKNSFENQKEYFEEYIKRHGNMQLYKIYADRGVSGTETSKRVGFKEMIADAEKGRFSLILTKEVSRFARNTLDVLTYTRKLKGLGVNVIFLSDSINTGSEDGELRLSIMATIAQEESRKISERVKFGQLRQMEKGVVFGRSMLGYDVCRGKLFINEEGAEIVKSIFCKFLYENKNIREIANELSENGVKTYSGSGAGWNPSVINKILRNEKYVGDLCQGKTYTSDCLSHKKMINCDANRLVYIKNHHSDIAIISRDMWNQVQKKLGKTRRCGKRAGTYWAAGLVYCGACGEAYVPRLIKRKDGSGYVSMKCMSNIKFGGSKKKNGCSNCSVNEFILAECADYLLRAVICDIPDFFEKTADVIRKTVLHNHTLQRNSLQKLADKYCAKKKKLIDLYIDKMIGYEEFELLKKEYSENISHCLGRLNELESTGDGNGGICQEYIDKVFDFDNYRCREVYESLFDRITVAGENTLHFSLKGVSRRVSVKYKTCGKMNNYAINILNTEFI